MNLKEGLQISFGSKMALPVIARKIYSSYPTYAFKDNEEMEFDIKNSIADFFRIPFSSIHICGSSKTGYSPYKSREFVKGESDLDIAIINLSLFMEYSEYSHMISKGYSDLSKFSRDRNSGESNDVFFLKTLNTGYFRPDLMPKSDLKIAWFDFFRKLSNKYYLMFKNVNAGIYASQYFFESKQIDSIIKFKRIIHTI